MSVKKLFLSLLSLTVLWTVGVSSQAALEETWQEIRSMRFSKEPAQDLPEQESAWALLGGFRFFAADLAFLNAYHYWQEGQMDEANIWHAWATMLDPESLFFWQVRIRVVGRDTPVWRIKQIGWLPDVDEAIQEKIFTEQAQAGLQVVEDALYYHPEDFSLWMDKGLFYEMRLQDFAAAEEAFLQAWELNKNYLGSALMYLEMLRRQEKQPEAKAFLKRYPQIEKSL